MKTGQGMGENEFFRVLAVAAVAGIALIRARNVDRRLVETGKTVVVLKLIIIIKNK